MNHYRRGKMYTDIRYTVANIKKRLEVEELKTWQLANPSLRDAITRHVFVDPITVDTVYNWTESGTRLDPPLKCQRGDWLSLDASLGTITVYRDNLPTIVYERHGAVFQPQHIPYSQ